ncbi:MAG TPA: DUF5670 family protein [Anaerolineae bacterium]|jgi:hypothetical protein|nr:DUF5670 family protein [Anaerolineae bacterium]
MTNTSILLWMVCTILLIIWGISVLISLAGGFIHLLLIISVLVLVIGLAST